MYAHGIHGMPTDVTSVYFHYCTVVAVSATSDTARFRVIAIYPTTARSANPGYEVDPVPGTTVCDAICMSPVSSVTHLAVLYVAASR